MQIIERHNGAVTWRGDAADYADRAGLSNDAAADMVRAITAGRVWRDADGCTVELDHAATTRLRCIDDMRACAISLRLRGDDAMAARFERAADRLAATPCPVPAPQARAPFVPQVVA